MKANKAGFLLLEFLVALSLLTLSTSFLYLSYNGWSKCYYKIQLRIAARLLASDLRRLQTQVMFRHSTSSFNLITNSNMKGYMISYNIPPIILLRRSFDKNYCSGVYLVNSLVLGFSSSGSPSATGTLILRHEKLPQHSIQVELQPITGRVLVNEN